MLINFHQTANASAQDMYEKEEDPIDDGKDQEHEQCLHGLYRLLGGQIEEYEDGKYGEEIVTEDARPTRHGIRMKQHACSRDGEGGGEDQQKGRACDGAGGAGEKIEER